MLCPYCHREAESVTGREVYPHRRDLWTQRFIMCRPCRAWVGCHKKTGKPFGRLANEELRAIRRKTHAAFDPIWKDGGMSRTEAYQRLAVVLGIPVDECHIGDFDEAMCKQAIEGVKRAELRGKAGTGC